jgi:UDP-arabinose 4-epimerase
MSKVILVTGGAGYIGSHACKALKSAGLEPVTVDNLVCGHERSVKWGPLFKGDIQNDEALDAAFERYKPAGVIHFAAYAYVYESMIDPQKYYRNNVGGTLNLLEAMRRHKCDKIVFSSTCATYGLPDKLPLSEDHPQRPISPYGRSKLMIEEILKDYERAYGLRHAALRYFNAAGSDPDSQIGERHDPETHLVPLVIGAAQGLRPFVNICGGDYPTLDGTAVRDYIHVTDLAQAHVAAAQNLLDGGLSFTLNLGTGEGYTVRQVVDMVEKISGKPVPVREAERRLGDPPALFADASAARSLLNWRPRYSDIESVVATAWRWHEGHHAA